MPYACVSMTMADALCHPLLILAKGKMMKKTDLVKKLMLAAVMFPLAAQAAQAVEMAFFGELPKDFKIGYQTKQNGMAMVELVPQKQTVDNWTKMITLQSMAGANLGAEGFRNNMANLWQNACPKSSFNPITEGEANGYSAAVWQLTCEYNPQTGKPEYTWFKAIQGDDSLYVTQYAFRYAPNKKEIHNALDQLRKFTVCDSSEQHLCSKSGK